MEQALTSLGHTDINGFRDWYFGRVGMAGLDSCVYCVEHFGLALEPRVIYDLTEKIRREVISLQPAPIITTTITFMQQVFDKNIKIGVASSDFPDNIRKHLEQANALRYVKAMTSGEKHSGEVTKDKPDPEVYLVTAKKLGVEPRNCIGVEDTSPGIAAVKSAGMFCIAYKNPLSGKQDYSAADLVADDLSLIRVSDLQNRFSVGL